MSQPANNVFSQIESHIHYGEWKEADKLIRGMGMSSDIPDQDSYKLEIYQAHVLIEMEQMAQARDKINQLVNNVSELPKSLQLQVLHVSSKFAYNAGEYGLAEVYIDKFNEIFNAISVVLKDKTQAFRADVKNIQGLLLSNKNEIKKALKLFEEVVSSQKQLGRVLHQGIASYNAGKIAIQLEQANRSEVFLQDAYTIFKDMNYLKGQYQVAKSFIDCYKLKEDKEGVLSFQSISKDLKYKLEIEKLESSHQKQILEYKGEIEQLRSRVISLQSQLHNQDTTTDRMEEELDYLRNKSKDFKEVKELYSNLKDNIIQLEVKIQKQDKEIERKEKKIQDQRMTITRLTQQLREQQEIDYHHKPEKRHMSKQLEELLASSKLLDNIYYKLKEVGLVNTKLLAMQLQVSYNSCEEAITQLEEIDAVRVEKHDNKVEVELK